MISLDILLWAFLASYVIHMVDETTMNGGFIRWIQASFWPTYTSRMNFWFNGGAVLAITGSNLLYDLLGGHWVILALIWPFGFALHGLTVHLFWTIRQRNLSPGLVTSVIYWIMAYFLVRYGFVAGQIAAFDFWTGALLGVFTVGTFLTFTRPSSYRDSAIEPGGRRGRDKLSLGNLYVSEGPVILRTCLVSRGCS